ncbi:hypothetical protein ACF1HJ_43940 [Streptomyces sp. NPDC013978]|uniref:hypothetical protein n=1 Tax=Streptomyces sp. NPDC013978 TaxID=3364869 RepID=UPI0036FCED52
MSLWDLARLVLQFAAGHSIGTWYGALGVVLLSLASALIMPTVRAEKEKPAQSETNETDRGGVPWWVVLLVLLAVIQF